MSEKITFKKLVEKISKSTRLSEQTSNSIIHELADNIESGIEKADKIILSGFGRFELKWMNQQKEHNPQSGDEITIPVQNQVVFKPYKALREHVNKPYKHLEVKILDESSDQNETEQPMVSPETVTAASAAGKNIWANSDISHGDPYSWPVFYERNNDEIDDPTTNLAGKSLNLPKLSDPYNLTQKDRETVARGYLYVYDWMTDHQPDKAKYCSWAVGSYSKEQLQRVSARINGTDLAFAFQQ